MSEYARDEMCRLIKALTEYALQTSLDAQVQNDLMAIAGARHIHRSNNRSSDICALCGHDLRHEIHIRGKL